jgi:hypothetical protein
MPVGVVAVVVVALISGCASKDGAMTPKQRYDALFAEMRTAQERGYAETVVAVERAYARLFPEPVRSSIVSKADRDELASLFDAAKLTAWHTLDARHVRDALAAFDAMGRGGGPTEEQRATMRDLMVNARMFEPHAKVALPRFRDEARGDGPTELVVTSDALIRRSIPMTGAQIIVISHPGCHFSAAAKNEIGNDAVLAQIFADHARWLVPQESSADAIHDVSTPGFPYTLAYKRSELPMIDGWSTPTFYFLDGARVVRKVVGWPKEGRMQELRESAQAIGLAP